MLVRMQIKDDLSVLPKESIEKFKALMEQEGYGTITDEEARDKTESLVKLFATLSTNDSEQDLNKPITVTEVEGKCLKHIHHCIHHERIKVTVRGIANAVGLKSSRSGMKLLQSLIAKGYAYKDEGRNVRLSREVDGCGTKFNLV